MIQDWHKGSIEHLKRQQNMARERYQDRQLHPYLLDKAIDLTERILDDLMKQMTRKNALEWAAEMLLDSDEVSSGSPDTKVYEILYRAADVIENALAGGMLEENLRRMFAARRKNHPDEFSKEACNLIAEDEYVAGRFIKDEERCPECGTFLDGEETCSLCED